MKLSDLAAVRKAAVYAVAGKWPDIVQEPLPVNLNPKKRYFFSVVELED